MKKSYIEFLTRNRASLTGHLDFEGDLLLDELVSSKVITKMQRKQIMRGDAIDEVRAGRLLDFLEKRTDKEFEDFCRILNEADGQTEAKTFLTKLTGDDYQLIFGKPAPADQAALQTSPQTPKESRSSHGADGTSSEEEKRERFRQRLTDNRVALVNDLNLQDGVFDYLIQDRVVGRREQDRLTDRQTNADQASNLLDYLHTRPLKDMENFIKALHKTHQEHLAKLLE